MPLAGRPNLHGEVWQPSSVAPLFAESLLHTLPWSQSRLCSSMTLFGFQFCHLLAVWSWATYLISLYLWFFVCKMEIITSSQVRINNVFTGKDKYTMLPTPSQQSTTCHYCTLQGAGGLWRGNVSTRQAHGSWGSWTCMQPAYRGWNLCLQRKRRRDARGFSSDLLELGFTEEVAPHRILRGITSTGRRGSGRAVRVRKHERRHRAWERRLCVGDKKRRGEHRSYMVGKRSVGYHHSES